MVAPSLAGLEMDALDIIGPDHYQQHGYPHAEWTLLRREAPISWFDRHEGPPFWAVTRHEDIVFLSKQPKRFQNGPRLAVFPDQEGEEEPPGRHLLIMDPPMHARYRRLISQHFTPRALRAKQAEIRRIASEILDEVSCEGSSIEFDFVEKVSSVLPLAVIADMLGVPRADWRQLFRWTNESIGSGDPEYRRPGETPEETGERARVEMLSYFGEMVAERRKSPRQDLVSLLANARLDGEQLPDDNLFSYYNLIVIAGNETTRNATSGGLLALIEHPEQLQKLQRQPELVPTAVEEIVRWTTPVIQFCRTAVEDVELRGQKIRAGQAFCLFYASANRDEAVFDAPFAFRVDRRPNPHLAFGIGEHFCLGANVARLELRVMFQQLAERLQEVELCGPVERLRSSFLGGVKHMPVRWQLRSA